MKILFTPSETWPVIGDYDVVVIGAGPGGLGAAVAAARMGLRTIVVERHGFPGGTGTASCVPYLLGYAGSDDQGKNERQIIGGIADELVRELDGQGQAAFLGLDQAWPSGVPERLPIGNRPLLHHVMTSVEGLCLAYNRLFQRAGVTMLYYASCLGAVVQGDRIAAAAMDCVEGPGLIKGKAFVDATGDAHFVHRAGGEVTDAPPEEWRARTLNARLGGVKGFFCKDLKERFEKLSKEGKVPLEDQHAFLVVATLLPDEVLLNYTVRFDDSLTSAGMTRMDVGMREQIAQVVPWLRRMMPGFQDCHVTEIAAAVGLRNGRNIVGQETMTRGDVDEDVPVPEPVTLARRGYGGSHNKKGVPLPHQSSRKGVHPIPWKTLLPKSFSNVTVGGRGIASDSCLVDTYRLMPTCMSIGQAAGVTAALAARKGVSAVEVGYGAVRAELLRGGVILE